MRRHGMMIGRLAEPVREGRGVDSAATRGEGQPMPAVEDPIEGITVFVGFIVWIELGDHHRLTSALTIRTKRAAAIRNPMGISRASAIFSSMSIPATMRK